MPIMIEKAVLKLDSRVKDVPFTIQKKEKEMFRLKD